LLPRNFKGRIIEQYEYTLQTEAPGEYHISPVTLITAGPRQIRLPQWSNRLQLNIRGGLECTGGLE
jgi:hypothetical protein